MAFYSKNSVLLLLPLPLSQRYSLAKVVMVSFGILRYRWFADFVLPSVQPFSRSCSEIMIITRRIVKVYGHGL